MIPVIAGIPYIAGLLGGLFTSLVSFVALYLTKRLALVVVAVGIMLAVTVTFWSACDALIAGIQVTAPHEINQAIALILPDNFRNCFSAVMSAHFLRWVYEWNVKIIQLKLF
jgi:hypothetical protein